jgi:nitrogen fixation protein NifQ
MNGPDRKLYRQVLQNDLLSRLAEPQLLADPNRFILASMIAGQTVNSGCLPVHLGIGPETFAQLLADYFPGSAPRTTERKLITIPEWDDLYKLLISERAGQRESERWMASIVATGCAGSDHLWQDLGLANRDELSQLMQLNFPTLAAANSSDMKWKKFLYRQVCSREGIYVCPAPSCGVCTDFAKCFGPEN